MYNRISHKLKIAAVTAIVFILPELLLAQYHYFGRNKVQYTDFNWQVLKTEHFNIYFYPEMREVAEIGAAAAESSYVALSAKFDHTLTRRIPLIFYSSHLLFQQTNVTPGFIPEGVGGFFEFIKGRVVIPSNGSMHQFRRVIAHELIHVFMTSKVQQIYEDRKIYNQSGPPLWFVEGLAEYWSTKQLDTQSRMVLRDAILNNYFAPLTAIYQINGTYLMYKEGENLLGFLSKTYGPETILLLLENIWRNDNFMKVIEFVTGDTIEEISRKWEFALKRQFYPVLKDEDLPQATTKMLTHKGVNLSPAIYSREGEKYLAFLSNRSGYTNIYTKLLAVGKNHEAKVLVKGERSQEYESFHMMDAELSVSENNILAFVTKSGESDALHIWDIDKKEPVKSFTFPDIVGISSPDWNGDGKTVAFSGMSYSGKVDLYLFDTETERLIRLTNDVYNDRGPVFSPDGKYIYFSSDRTEFGRKGYTNIFRFDLHNGDIRYLTHTQHFEVQPVISPNGRYLAFLSDRDGTNNVWMLDLNQPSHQNGNDIIGYPVQQVTRFATAAMHPVWVDDSTLACTAFDSYQFQIHEIKAPKFETTSQQWRIAGNNLWKYPHFPITDSTRVKPYKAHYSLDVAVTQISNDPIFGTSGGGQLAFSDIMGNRRWEVLIYNSARSTSEFWQRFNVYIAKYNLEHRANFGYGIFHFNNLYYTPREGFYNERRYGGQFMLRYPFSQFRRVEATVNAYYSQKDLFDAKGPRDAVLVSNFISYVKDNSIWGPTGPMDGRRFLVRAGFTNDLRYNNVNYYTLICDYRRYFRLSQRTAYALRLMALRSEGSEAQRFYIGGSWTLRGYPRFKIWGKKAFLINNELRFPLIDQLGVRFPFGAIGFRQVRGALFLDAGNAWEKKLHKVRGSFGIGLRVNIGGVLVLRYDIGRRTDFKSIGSKTFYQFFFGWDY